jgi:hypothetical protein
VSAQGKKSEKKEIEAASFEDCCWLGFKLLTIFQELRKLSPDVFGKLMEMECLLIKHSEWRFILFLQL